MELALVGELIFGLGTLALALFSWDFAEFSRYPSFERKALARLKTSRAGLVRGSDRERFGFGGGRFFSPFFFELLGFTRWACAALAFNSALA
jgi:hypothetical protein